MNFIQNDPSFVPEVFARNLEDIMQDPTQEGLKQNYSEVKNETDSSLDTSFQRVIAKRGD